MGGGCPSEFTVTLGTAGQQEIVAYDPVSGDHAHLQVNVTGVLPKVSVLTQRYNNARTGANLQEPVLNVATVSSPAFQKLYEIDVDGQVYAQPLLVSNVLGPNNQLMDILLIATMNNTLSAWQVDNGVYGSTFAPQLLWKVNFGTPVASNFMPMANSTETCANGGQPEGGSMCVSNPGDTAPQTAPPLPPIFICCPPTYNINPIIGILSTPVVDPFKTVAGVTYDGAIYGVAAIMNGAKVEHHLWSVDLVSGTVTNNVLISGSVSPTTSADGIVAPDSQNGEVTFDPSHEMQRPALLLTSGNLYVAFGSHQDTRIWHGWVFQYGAAYGSLSATPIGVWNTTPSAVGGAIWQAGGGLAADDAGNVYAMTGNGEPNTEGQWSTDNSWKTSDQNYANMFVELSNTNPGVDLINFFAPSDETTREQQDLDVGSAGPVIMNTSLSTNSYNCICLVGGEKESEVFVLDTQDNLQDRQVFQAGKPEDSGFDWAIAPGAGFHHIHGSPVVWRNSNGVMTLYVWPERDHLRSFSWNDTTGVFDCPNSGTTTECVSPGSGGASNTPGQQSDMTAPDCDLNNLPPCSFMPGGIISLSSNGATPGSGVLWASIPKSDDALYKVVPGVLRAFNAESIKTEIWDSEINPSHDGGFNFAKYTPPVVANGRVYMATFSNSVNVYGLCQLQAQAAALLCPRTTVGP